jgi:dCTP diphosphatase
MAIAVEAAELMEQSQWITQDEAWELARDDCRLKMMSEELADILIYALSFAEALHTAVATAVVDKLERNAEKYPEDDSRGSASWLDRMKGGEA